MAWIAHTLTLPLVPNYPVHTNTYQPEQNAFVEPLQQTSIDVASSDDAISTDRLALWRGLFWATIFQGVAACTAAMIWRLGTS